MLAVKSRHVKIKVLNDSKEVALIVYITTFAAVETAIMTFVLQNYNNVGESLFTGHTLVATTAAVVITFVPKVCYACACVIATYNIQTPADTKYVRTCSALCHCCIINKLQCHCATWCNWLVHNNLLENRRHGLYDGSLLNTITKKFVIKKMCTCTSTTPNKFEM